MTVYFNCRNMQYDRHIYCLLVMMAGCVELSSRRGVVSAFPMWRLKKWQGVPQKWQSIPLLWDALPLFLLAICWKIGLAGQDTPVDGDC